MSDEALTSAILVKHEILAQEKIAKQEEDNLKSK
jgi:hypothetical protein